MLDRRPDSPVPDKIFGTGTGNRYESSISVWSRSRPGPDGPCTIYLFIYSRLRTAGSCGTMRHPAAIGEPSAQRRTRNVAPTRAVALRGANGVWMWMNGGAVVLRNVARWVIRVCWPAWPGSGRGATRVAQTHAHSFPEFTLRLPEHFPDRHIGITGGRVDFSVPACVLILSRRASVVTYATNVRYAIRECVELRRATKSSHGLGYVASRTGGIPYRMQGI